MGEIELRDVGVTRRGIVVLEGVNLRIDPGDRMCLVGASGSGKTSLLRVIAGIDPCTTGRVTIDGSPVTGPRREVTMVFQDDSVYDHLDVAGNLDFPFRVTGVEAGESIDASARAFSIRGLLSRRPRTLSAGQRRVVSAARALVRPEVEIALLDEALTGTDPHRRDRLIEAILIRSELTVVMASNDPSDALRWAERVVVLDGGGVAQIGSPRDVHRRPLTLRVADIMGEMNRVPGAVTASPDWSVAVGGSRLRLDPVPRGLLPGQRVVVGLRPAELALASGGVPFDRLLRGRVGRVELVGPRLRVLFGLGDSVGVGFVAEIDPEAGVRAGDRVDWHVPPETIRLYDPGSGTVL